MKLFFLPLLALGLLITQLVFSSAQPPITPDPVSDTKAAAFEVLQTRCNVCHRRQNPFKVFSRKNMEKHAPKIQEQVFVLKRMPRGDAPKLTEREAAILSQWLHKVQEKPTE